MCTMSYAMVQNRMKVPIPPVSPPKNNPDADTCTQGGGGGWKGGIGGKREHTSEWDTDNSW